MPVALGSSVSFAGVPRVPSSLLSWPPQRGPARLRGWPNSGSVRHSSSSAGVDRHLQRLRHRLNLGSGRPVGNDPDADCYRGEGNRHRRKRRCALGGEAVGPGLDLTDATGAAWPLPGPVCLVVGAAPRRRRGERLAGIHELHGGLIEELLFSELEDILLTTPHWSDSLAVSVAGAT